MPGIQARGCAGRLTTMRDHVKALTLAVSAGVTISPDASLVLAAVWLLPGWVKQWIDVRDRWRR